MTGDREKTRIAAGAEEALDAVVRALMSAEAPTDLRARVLASLDEPPTGRGWMTPRRLAWAGLTVAVFLVAYLAWPRPGTPPITVPDQAATAPQPSRPGSVTVPGDEASGARRAAGRPTGIAPRTARARQPFPFRAYRFTVPVVAPMENPSPVVIAPLAEPQVTIEPLDIEPLSFTPVTIEPLGAGR